MWTRGAITLSNLTCHSVQSQHILRQQCASPPISNNEPSHSSCNCNSTTGANWFRFNWEMCILTKQLCSHTLVLKVQRRKKFSPSTMKVISHPLHHTWMSGATASWLVEIDNFTSAIKQLRTAICLTPGFQRSVSVSVANYAIITFICKNSVRTP